MTGPPPSVLPFTLRNRYGDPLRGNIHLPAGSGQAPVLLICHGFKGFKDWGFFPVIAHEFALSGYAAVRFNFSLNGIGDDPCEFTRPDNFRRNTLSRELNDLGEMIDAVCAGGLLPSQADTGRLALLGHSRGGGITLIKAAEDRRVRAVATWAAVSTFERWGPQTIRQWREKGELEIVNQRTGLIMPMGIEALDDYERNMQRFDIRAAAAGLSMPFLILHGEKDVSVPVEEAHALHEAAHPDYTELHVIPRADHTFGAVHPFAGMTEELRATLARTREWLSRAMPAV